MAHTSDNITTRELETIGPIIDRIMAEIAAKTEEYQAKQTQANELQAEAKAARSKGAFTAAWNMEQAAQEARDQAQAIKKQIDDLDKEHERLLYRARSCRIEYR